MDLLGKQQKSRIFGPRAHRREHYRRSRRAILSTCTSIRHLRLDARVRAHRNPADLPDRGHSLPFRAHPAPRFGSTRPLCALRRLQLDLARRAGERKKAPIRKPLAPIGGANSY